MVNKAFKITQILEIYSIWNKHEYILWFNIFKSIILGLLKKFCDYFKLASLALLNICTNHFIPRNVLFIVNSKPAKTLIFLIQSGVNEMIYYLFVH